MGSRQQPAEGDGWHDHALSAEAVDAASAREPSEIHREEENEP
jgi:hypothetical protein